MGGVGRWHEKVFILDTQGNEKTQNENRKQEEEWKVRTVATLSRFKGQKWQRSLTHPDSTQERTKAGDESFIDQMAQSQNVQSNFPQVFPWTSGFDRSELVTGTSHSKTLCLNDLHRQMQRLHPSGDGLSQKMEAMGIPSVHQTSPLFYCIYNREEEREGRERGKRENRGEGCRESGGLGQRKGPGERGGEGTRGRENWKK